MRTILIALCCLAAAPAQAQFWGGVSDGQRAEPDLFEPAPHRGIVQKSDRSVDEARKSGRISRAEAREFRRERNRIVRTGRDLARDGLTDAERGSLNQQALILKGLIDARLSRGPT